MMTGVVFVLVLVVAIGCPTLVWAEGKRTAQHRHQRFAAAVSEWVAGEVGIPGRASDGSDDLPAEVLGSVVEVLLRPVAPPRSVLPAAS